MPCAIIAVGDLAAWALVVVSACLVVATIIYTINTRKQVEEMRIARELAMAPDVVVYLHVDHRTVASIVVENIGKGIARDIKMKFDPNLKTSKDFDPTKMSIIEDGIDVLIPGQKIMAFLDLTIDYLKQDLPLKYKAAIEFSGGMSNEKQTNHCVVDFQVYKGLRETPLKTLHELVKAVESIGETIKNS